MMKDVRTALGNLFVGIQTQWWRMHERRSIHGTPNKIRWWRMHEQHLTINSLRSGLDGGGYMNDNQFMGFRIRFDDGGCTNSARHSIPRVPDSVEEDA